MSTILPPLGPGLGVRDTVAGHLVPQIKTTVLSDDNAEGGFYALTRQPCRLKLPYVVGAEAWLTANDLFGVIVRPDGYALAGARTADQLALASANLPDLPRYLPKG